MADNVAPSKPTDRQLHLLALHGVGQTFSEIGEHENLSIWTVKWELDRLRRLINARSLSHALVICIGRGEICVDSRSFEPFVPSSIADAA